MEKPDSSAQEVQPVNIRAITADELQDMIYKGESLPQDLRFLPMDDGGVFKYFFLDNVIGPRSDNFFYITGEINNEILGLAELEKDPFTDNNYWVKFVSIDPKYQGEGYSRKIVEEIFKFAKNKNCSLGMSYYTDDGSKKLKKIFDEYAEKYSVKLIEEE